MLSTSNMEANSPHASLPACDTRSTARVPKQRKGGWGVKIEGFEFRSVPASGMGLCSAREYTMYKLRVTSFIHPQQLVWEHCVERNLC